MITHPGHSLTLGNVDLLGTDHSAGWWIEAAGEGADLGSPVPVEKAILSFLIDGSLESYESFDNREMTLTLTMKATTSANLAAAESALMAEVAKRNVLTWTPPDNTGAFAGTPCIFDVVNSYPKFEFSDIDELYLQRVYTLTIKALPFTRSGVAQSMTNPAPPGTTPTVTLVDNCASTTGWTTAGAGTVSHVTMPTYGGRDAIYTSVTNTGSTTATKTAGLTRSGLSISMASTPYVRIFTPLIGYAGVAYTQTVKINGTVVAEAARNGEMAWYLCPTGTLNSVTVTRTASVPHGRYVSLTIADISRSNIPQDVSGARQRAFSVPVVGSARTQGSLAVEDPSVALGSVLVYSTAVDVSALQQPPLRTMRTAGSAETTDTTLVSGKFSDLATNHVFQVPSTSLAPGGYVFLARVKAGSASSYTLSWAAKSVMGTTAIESSQSGTQSVALAASTWAVVTVARMYLPSAVMGSSGMTQIELSGPSGVLLDEAWLFNLDTGRLTWVECGTATPAAGGSANRVFVDAPSLDSPVWSVSIGTEAERSDAFNPGTAVRSFPESSVEPPQMSVFVVTSNSVAAAVTLTYFPRFHTHVA